MRNHHKQWTQAPISRDCPLCGSDKTTVVSRRMQHRLDLPTVICRQCSLVFTNPAPSVESYNRFYQEAYSHFYGHIAVRPEGHYREQEPPKVQPRLQRIEAFHHLAGSRLLELGPGQGLFLWWAQKHGSSVLGVEPSIDFHNALVEDGLPCLHATLEEVDPAQVGRFNIIVMMHVFEHFHDPNLALKRCRELLEDNGMLVIEVPNILKPYRSLDRYFLRYVHLTNFSPQTLRAMLSKHGFEIVGIDEGSSDWRIPRHLSVIARKTDAPAQTFSLPDQTADEVAAILRDYRRRWALGRGLTWYAWNYAKNHPRLMRAAQRFKHP